MSERFFRKSIHFVREKMTNRKIYLIIGLIAFLGAGCSLPVLKQDIPVSTNPTGAKIYANGQLMGITPGSVALERNRDHIITLMKDNYRQEDVFVKKQYQQSKVLMKAIQSGVNSGIFFKDSRMAINSGMGSISMQEDTGEAYILVPPAIIVNLSSLYGPPATPAVLTPAPGTETTGSTIQARDLLAAGVVAGAAVGAAQSKPIEKRWDTSSSSRSYTKSDGTQVTEKSSTSVGVSFNPAGMAGIIDTLFSK
jgi:hypothetical protein